MATIAYSRTLPVVAEPDLLVCGTGLAGIGAAVAAARNGATVMAVDRMGFAGGFFTNVELTFDSGWPAAVTRPPRRHSRPAA